MNFPYRTLLVMPQKYILILSMNLFPGFPPYSWNKSIAVGHQPARKSLRRIIPTETAVRKSLHLLFY